MKTLGESLGIKDGRLSLNSAKTAACPHCGRPPRRQESTTPRGLVVEVFIPVEHICRRERVMDARKAEEGRS